MNAQDKKRALFLASVASFALVFRILLLAINRLEIEETRNRVER